MTPTPTPGQVCYEAYRHAASPVVGDALMRWDETNERYRAIWDAAAQAVVTHVEQHRALACDVHAAVWAQIARCDCDLTRRVPVGALCVSCDSLKSIADAAQGVLAMQESDDATP